MKVSVNAILALLIIALVGFEFWQYRQLEAQKEGLEQQLLALQIRVDELDKELARRESEEQASGLGTILEEANKALVDGWSVMVDAVEKELQRAQKELEERRHEGAQKPAEAPQSDYGPGAL